MAILKCKMCGGSLELIPDENICECEFCGTRQTVPNIDDEKKAKLYERAIKLRFNCEFDKAASVYEHIINEFPDDAEAYWGLILCNYGIEYVDDPASGKKVPTCHRSSFESLMDDPDFEMVMENSESNARALYRSEAKQIEEIRKGIVEVSGKEEPYDIFICYKETDEDGQRTLDSVLAQDVYDALTSKEYRVFFSRISLEDKLGTEYEPYIFAALNSAKVMLVFGTSYDYFNAVWVKNEWARFLKLMTSDKEKYLIPCFKDVDAYDIPKEFKKFQAQDLGKVGATQDLLRGIDKLLRPNEISGVQIVNAQMNENKDYGMSVLNAQVSALIKRAFMMVEDGEFSRADNLFEQVLNNDPESGRAYWGKAMCEIKCRNTEELLSEVKNRIIVQKKPTTFSYAIDIIDYAKRINDGKYSVFTSKELYKIFQNIHSVTSNGTDYYVTIESSEDYFRSLYDNFSVDTLCELLNNRDFDRSVRYADDLISSNIDTVMSSVKPFLYACAESEKDDLPGKKEKKIMDLKEEIIQMLDHRASNKHYKVKKKEKEDKQNALRQQREAFEEELKSVKVRFNNKRKKEIEKEIDRINKELEQLSHIFF